MKILVCEDCTTMQEFWKSCLSDYGTLTIAGSGQEAITVIEDAFKADEPFDLACIDLVLGDIDGYTVQARIREIEKELGLKRRTKIIVASAKQKRLHYLKAYFIGCEAYIAKPLTKEKVEKELKQLKIQPVQCAAGQQAE